MNFHYVYVGPASGTKISQRGKFPSSDNVVFKYGNETISTPLTLVKESSGGVWNEYYQLPGSIQLADDGWVNGKKIVLTHIPVPEGFALAYSGQPELEFGKNGYRLKDASEKNIDIGIPVRLVNEKTDISKASSFCNVWFTMNTLIYKYTGKEIKPPVTVGLNTIPLVEGVDYTISYENNVRQMGVGDTYKDSGRVVVTGNGNLCGKCIKYFEIMDSGAVINDQSSGQSGNTDKSGNEAKTNKESEAEKADDSKIQETNIVIKKTNSISLKAGTKSFTLKWKKVKNVSGYVIQYARNKSFKSGKKIITVKKSKTVSKKISKLKAKKKLLCQD